MPNFPKRPQVAGAPVRLQVITRPPCTNEAKRLVLKGLDPDDHTVANFGILNAVPMHADDQKAMFVLECVIPTSVVPLVSSMLDPKTGQKMIVDLMKILALDPVVSWCLPTDRLAPALLDAVKAKRAEIEKALKQED